MTNGIQSIPIDYKETGILNIIYKSNDMLTMHLKYFYTYCIVFFKLITMVAAELMDTFVGHFLGAAVFFHEDTFGFIHQLS